MLLNVVLTPGKPTLFCKIRKVKIIPADVTTFYRETLGTRREGCMGGGVGV